MQVKVLGNGPVAEYTVNGSVVKIGGDDGIEIDCEALQVDAAATVDICRGTSGNLVNGVDEGVSYVATIVIPPQEKSEQMKTEDGESVLDGDGNQIYEVVVSPLNMGKVKLFLWPFENPDPVSQE